MSSKLFKPGDKVRVKQGLETKEYSDNVYCDKEMVKQAGKVFEIKENHGFGYYLKRFGYSWTDEMLEPAAKYQVGDKVRVVANISELKKGDIRYRGGISGGMLSHAGKEFVIKSVSHGEPATGYYFEAREFGYIWDERLLETVESTEPVEPIKPEPPKPAFKIGDMVRITPSLAISGYHDIVSEMLKYAGKTATIANVSKCEVAPNGFKYDVVENGYMWYEDALELLPAANLAPETKTENMTITTTFEGAKTVCTISMNGKTFTGKAKCSPDDVWDEDKGRQIALARAQIKLQKAMLKELCGEGE